jgi:hypothetical protein
MIPTHDVTAYHRQYAPLFDMSKHAPDSAGTTVQEIESISCRLVYNSVHRLALLALPPPRRQLHWEFAVEEVCYQTAGASL